MVVHREMVGLALMVLLAFAADVAAEQPRKAESADDDKEVVNFSETRISAILVFHDPRQWAVDIQVMCDILQSSGIVKGPYVSLDKQTDPVELVFCNPDLTWRSDFEKPRLGQGAFITAFQAVYKV